jgi:hypothetical protein
MKFLKDRKNLIIIGLIAMILMIFGFYNNKTNQKNEQLKQKDKLIIALNDTVKTYYDSNNRLVSEKTTIQSDIKYLENENLILKDNQRLLINEVKKINKDNHVIAAALIDMGIKLGSLEANVGKFSEKDSSLLFTHKSDSLSYKFRITNVSPKFGKKPLLFIDSLNLFNKQLIEFHWKDERKEGYPISFTVRNSNPLFKTYDIESYAIPELNKSTIKPNFFQRTSIFIGKSKVPILIGVGSAALTYFIVK